VLSSTTADWAHAKLGTARSRREECCGSPMSGSDLLQTVVEGHPRHQARIYREFGGGRQGSLGPWRGFPAPGSPFQPRGGPPGGRHGRPGDDPGPSAGPNWPSAGFARVQTPSQGNAAHEFWIHCGDEVSQSNCQLTSWLEPPATRPTRRDQAKFSAPGPTQAAAPSALTTTARP